MDELDQATPEPGRTPIEDGWEPEQPRRGPIEYFRANPAKFFGGLGTLVFLFGWGVGIYFAIENPFGPGSGSLAYRLQILASLGSSATLAAGVLWAIAVYLWLNFLPDLPDSVLEQLDR